MTLRTVLKTLATGLILALSLLAPTVFAGDKTGFFPSIRRIELDRGKVCAGERVKVRIDWQANTVAHQDYQLTLDLAGIGRPPDFSTHSVIQPPATQWQAGVLVHGEDFFITFYGASLRPARPARRSRSIMPTATSAIRSIALARSKSCQPVRMHRQSR